MAAGNFDSSNSNVPAVTAIGTNGAVGITATSDTGNGIFAETSSDSQYALTVQYLGRILGGVIAQGGNGDGVSGLTTSRDKVGVFGRNDSTTNATSPGGSGVFGLTFAPDAAGVFGANNSETSGRGVHGNGPEAGVGGFSPGGNGIIGQSNTGTGVRGTCVNGVAIFGQAPTAGHFNGKVEINGDLEVSGDVILTGADCAEEFNIAEARDIEPGTVMVLNQDGALHQSQHAYDKRVAGVISGAGDYRPGLILDRRQSQDSRVLVALVGKVYCKVDAQYAPVEVGDLLTTSPTLGHAMKADDPFKAFGSVIGKALHPLKDGQGLIPILIALQ